MPGPGPLDFAARVAILHALVVAPSFPSLSVPAALFGSALAIPFLALCSWAAPSADPWIVFAAAAVCGACGRSMFFRGAMIALIALPYALGYLCEEFGAPESATAFENLSPLALHAGPGLALLLIAPVVRRFR